MTIDELFLRDEKRTKKLYDTELLAKLLLLNYEFSNNKYLGTTATDVFNNMHNVEYSKSEIQEIKNITKKIDESAFVIISNVKEVLGKGFSIN